jgi:esterase/lipase superfamily enzyme
VPADTLWYASSRVADDSGGPRRHSDSLEFGLIVSARREATDPTEDPLSFDLLDSIPLPSERFATLLAERTAGDGFAVLYTHGFGTSSREAWRQAIDARTRSRGDQPWVVFTWPSGDSWLARPRDGDVLAAGYRLDSSSAVASRPAFLRSLRVVRDAVGSDRLLLFTHSMGVQVAAEALAADSALRVELRTAPLRGIAFHAPDVDLVRFADVLVDSVRPLALRVVLYASAVDRALAASGQMSDTRRAGRIHRGDSLPFLHDGLESIDVTVGPSASNFWRRLLGARHGIRHSSGLVFDLIHVVGGLRSPECRETIATATRTAPTAWKLNTGPLPPPAAVNRCSVLLAPLPNDH